MIVRTWRGLASTEEAADAYAQHVEMTAFPKMKKLPGHIGACLSRRASPDGMIVLVMSYWETMSAIERFAGDTLQTAVVEPRARAVLGSFDAEVEHFELVVKSGQA